MNIIKAIEVKGGIKKVCYHGCVIEIEGEQKFACTTAPVNGMISIVNCTYLKTIHKNNLVEYNKGIKNGNFCKCSVSGSSDCSCSCNSL